MAQNLFKDTNTVIVDSSKTVDDPFANPGAMDGYNVNGWWNLGGNTLGLSRYVVRSRLGGGRIQIRTRVGCLVYQGQELDHRLEHGREQRE